MEAIKLDRKLAVIINQYVSKAIFFRNNVLS